MCVIVIMNIYFDTEFTGLHQQTTLISLGCISDNDLTFYAEFSDYDQSQCTDWILDNVISQLQYHKVQSYFNATPQHTSMKDTSAEIAIQLKKWLLTFAKLDAQKQPVPGSVKMWSDCLAYDWMLFCHLFGGALTVPSFIYYIPFDLSTLLLAFNYDPDISREAFAGQNLAGKHHALHDAQIIKKCHNKLLHK